MSTADTWGWAGTVRQFLSTPVDVWRQSLAAHHQRLMLQRHSSSQGAAWTDSYWAVHEALRAAATVEGDALEWSIVFEYELPLEGGRRPDVVVLAGGTIIVVECKSTAVVAIADLDQVEAYARDLGDYHKASHGRMVVPILLLVGAKGQAALHGDVVATSPDGLAQYLVQRASPMDDTAADLDEWLVAPYEPLPTLVAAAKRIFAHEPLPHVRAALAAGIPETVDRLVDICDTTEHAGGRTLVFVTGVPGSGKTLVGLRLVYERSTLEGKAAFLSGNGPLVDVLQDALRSSVFVKDLHRIVLAYGKQRRLPRENILVFDEAQRAWDRDQVERKHGISKSEPDLLVGIGEAVPGWTVLVGLVGEGQEIHTGEEAGMEQWSTAISPPNATVGWSVWCADKLRSVFPDHNVSCDQRLDLVVSLRSRRADVIHSWVADVLDAAFAAAARRSAMIHAQGFPMYLTRDLDEARDYARWRFRDEPDKRYGLVASSHAKVLAKHGVANDFMSTNKMMRFGQWYNSPRTNPRSCCALTTPVTEFGCQGLELDLPIVCWGEDMRWTGSEWRLTPIRRRVRQEDPEQLLINAYRVLLTRGRDGFVVYLPDERSLDATEVVLLAAGIKPLPEAVALPAADVG